MHEGPQREDKKDLPATEQPRRAGLCQALGIRGSTSKSGRDYGAMREQEGSTDGPEDPEH